MSIYTEYEEDTVDMDFMPESNSYGPVETSLNSALISENLKEIDKLKFNENLEKSDQAMRALASVVFKRRTRILVISALILLILKCALTETNKNPLKFYGIKIKNFLLLLVQDKDKSKFQFRYFIPSNQINDQLFYSWFKSDRLKNSDRILGDVFADFKYWRLALITNLTKISNYAFYSVISNIIHIIITICLISKINIFIINNIKNIKLQGALIDLIKVITIQIRPQLKYQQVEFFNENTPNNKPAIAMINTEFQPIALDLYFNSQFAISLGDFNKALFNVGKMCIK